jgi:phosphoribosylformimino-5-aminoimidazole carboxamide ribonucleotide (ProFAR) isomerase
VPPTLDELVTELVGLGVVRLVLAHGGAIPDPALISSLGGRHGVQILVAGGAADLDGIRRLRDAGVAGLILGEALLSGAIDLPSAMEAAA